MQQVAQIPPARTDAALDVLTAARAREAAALDEHGAKAMVAAFGLSVPQGARVAPDASAADVAGAVRGLTPPFALKALADAALHKSDLGAVQLGLGDGAAVAQALAEVRARMTAAGVPVVGYLIEEMAWPGIEIVIGGTHDPQLGPMIMLGAGGVFAEILRDTTFRLCPISADDAGSMIDDLRITAILDGARGRAPVDRGAIVAALLALGGADGLFTRHADRIAEFDLNPLIARSDGLVAVDARIVLGHGVAMGDDKPDDSDVCRTFAPLFAPRSIAVIGASASTTTAGNRFLRLLRETGFAGQVYPIHPTAPEIEGHTAYASLAHTPETVDYAYLTVPAERVEGVLRAGAGRLRFAQVMASTDPALMPAWQDRLREIAQEGGFRVIGPNCMGTHAPRGRFTFMEGADCTPGAVGIVSQSGGLGMDILRRGQTLGLRFSGLVTMGNSADLGPSDLLEFYLNDPETRVIGLYVEDVKDGRRFQRLLRANRGRKPVVLLAGGITAQGQEAAASHTGALAGSPQAWRALARQTGALLTETLDTFLAMLSMCLWLRPGGPGPDAGITLFGNGGGASVLATDTLERAGLALARPDAAARAAFDAIILPPGASLANPIDLPASVLRQEDGRLTARILDVNDRLVAPYATIVHLNLPVILGYRHVPDFLSNLLDAVMGEAVAAATTGGHRLLVLRSDRSDEADAWRRTFRAAAAARNVPSFDEIPEAIAALAAYQEYECFFRTATNALPARASEAAAR
jgi:acyl-CoA synthetase (NDP forming)